MTAAEELDALNKLHAAGTITEEQYQRARVKLQHPAPVAPPPVAARPAPPPAPEEPSAAPNDARKWAVMMHFSLLVPFVGLIAPYVIWQVKRDDHPALDEHGRNAVNWALSYLIYFSGCVVLTAILIGVPLLIACLALGIAFPIIAGLRANDDKVWRYPLAIRFFD